MSGTSGSAGDRFCLIAGPLVSTVGSPVIGIMSREYRDRCEHFSGLLDDYNRRAV